MGRPKVKIIDDSQTPKEETKPEVIEVVEAPKDKKAQKPGKAKPRSKKYQEIIKDLDRSKTYPLSEAVDLVKKLKV